MKFFGILDFKMCKSYLRKIKKGMRKLKKNILMIIELILIVGLIIFHIKYVTDVEKMIEFGKNYEIERKWLVSINDIPYDLKDKAIEKEYIEQTYINFSPEIRVRDINNGEYYMMTMKGKSYFDKVAREEVNYGISEEEYNVLLQKKEGNTICKTRYTIIDNKNYLEFDVFEGEFEGLVYLEIEFKTVDDANKYEEPSWIVKEVTEDDSYKNGYLARFGIPDSYYEYIDEYENN